MPGHEQWPLRCARRRARWLAGPGPRTGPGPQLEWARVSHYTPYGRAEAGWTRQGEDVTVIVTVPPGTEAEVHLPAKWLNVTIGAIHRADLPVGLSTAVTDEHALPGGEAGRDPSALRSTNTGCAWPGRTTSSACRTTSASCTAPRGRSRRSRAPRSTTWARRSSPPRSPGR
ncbi:alpha-L-rhamnosidase C-terminal domain-containing protein [Nocardiopsis sp. Huas11]|uniref:alpha-L-rhamnosidase C-terminal domain-containing protein n=1 Tax=Nocardiopsis sp. Huas11 TaxID=2183912 RepID=UPI0035166C95